MIDVGGGETAGAIETGEEEAGAAREGTQEAPDTSHFFYQGIQGQGTGSWACCRMCMEATRAPEAYHYRLNWWTQNHAADAPELEENQYDGSFDDDESLQATP